MRQTKTIYYKNKFDTNRNDPNQAWKTIDDILGKKRKESI